MVTRLLIQDAGVFDQLIQERKHKGLDRYDEVWEGMYVMATMPNNAHQRLVGEVHVILPRLGIFLIIKGNGLKRERAA